MVGINHPNSYHFNIGFGDMRVHSVRHHHSIEASFGCLNPEGVPFYVLTGVERTILAL